MFEEIHLLFSSFSTFVSSLRLPHKPEVLQAKAEQHRVSSNRRLIYFLMDEKSRSKSVEEIVLQVRLDSSFAVFIVCAKLSHNTHWCK